MTDNKTLLDVDGRRRISLGPLASYDRYLAAVEPDGVIILTPAVVVPAAARATYAPLSVAVSSGQIEDNVTYNGVPGYRVRKLLRAEHTLVDVRYLVEAVAEGHMDESDLIPRLMEVFDSYLERKRDGSGTDGGAEAPVVSGSGGGDTEPGS